MNETEMNWMQQFKWLSHMGLFDSRGPSYLMPSLIWRSGICFTHYYCSLWFTGFLQRSPAVGVLPDETKPFPRSHLATRTNFRTKMNAVVRKTLQWPLSVSIKTIVNHYFLTFSFIYMDNVTTVFRQHPFFPEVSCVTLWIKKI